jgi:hypothetical protein
MTNRPKSESPFTPEIDPISIGETGGDDKTAPITGRKNKKIKGAKPPKTQNAPKVTKKRRKAPRKFTKRERAKSLATRKENAKARKKAKAEARKLEGRQAEASGGRVTKTGRIYGAEPIWNLQMGMREVNAAQALKNDAAGTHPIINLKGFRSDGTRSDAERLFLDFLCRHRGKGFLFLDLASPELADRLNKTDKAKEWSFTFYGKLTSWIRDVDLDFDPPNATEAKAPALFTQFQVKGASKLYTDLRKCLNPRTGAKRAKMLFRDLRKDALELLIRRATNRLLEKDCKDSPHPRLCYHISHRSILEWRDKHYTVKGSKVWSLSNSKTHGSSNIGLISSKRFSPTNLRYSTGPSTQLTAATTRDFPTPFTSATVTPNPSSRRSLNATSWPKPTSSTTTPMKP